MVGGWFAVQQRGWDSGFDGGAATVSFATDVLADRPVGAGAGDVAVLAGAVVLLVICIVQRLPLPLVIYGALRAGDGHRQQRADELKARLLLPAFTLLLPVALALARRRPAT